jgi:hypothetical protein
VRVQEKTHSVPHRVVEASEPHPDGSAERQVPIVLHPLLGLVRTPEEPATPRRTLDIDIVELLKQVVDKINIVVDKVDKTAKACVVLHP